MSTSRDSRQKRFNINSIRAGPTRIEKNCRAYRLVCGRQAVLETHSLQKIGNRIEAKKNRDVTKSPRLDPKFGSFQQFKTIRNYSAFFQVRILSEKLSVFLTIDRTLDLTWTFGAF